MPVSYFEEPQITHLGLPCLKYSGYPSPRDTNPLSFDHHGYAFTCLLQAEQNMGKREYGTLGIVSSRSSVLDATAHVGPRPG